MKKQELPKAPIQIQRDELIAKVASLQELLASKEKEVVTLQAELQLKSNSLIQKDGTIGNLQNELATKNKTITQNQETISQLEANLTKKNSDFSALENKLYLLENDVVILGDSGIEGQGGTD